MHVAPTMRPSHDPGHPWRGPQPPPPPRRPPWLGPLAAAPAQRAAIAAPAQPFVDPGTYASPVTRHHPPEPKGPIHLGWFIPVIVVGQDQSRSYDYVRVPLWSGPPAYAPYPAPVDPIDRLH